MFPWEKETFLENTPKRRERYRKDWAKYASTEEGKMANREKSKKTREENPEYLKDWRKKNPDKVKEHLKKQQSSDEYRNYMREYMREYRKAKKESGESAPKNNEED